MVEVRRYTPDMKTDWDAFVKVSKNGTFLFMRDYMDYHSDRFADHSLMFYDRKGRLVALLPANIVTQEDGSKTLFSHQGLTYGGFILSEKATVELVIKLFECASSNIKSLGVSTFHYKQMPTCYHRLPAEEDEYALWRMGATVEVCNISSTIALMKGTSAIPFERRRRRAIAKAKEAKLTIIDTKACDDFWQIMEENLLTRHNATPVHTVGEMNLLMWRFPENIKCHIVKQEQTIVAGAVIYITPMCVHIQYAHASAQGKQMGAIDMLYDFLITKYARTHKYVDIGTSNEQGGRILNHGLIAQKEGFGGRGIAYKQWILNI